RRQLGAEGGERLPSRLLERGVLREMAESEQGEDRHRVPGHHGTVIDLLRTCQELLLIAARQEPSTALVAEQTVDRSCDSRGLFQPARIESRFVEVDQPVGEEGVVFEEGGDLRLPVAPGVEETAVRTHLRENEVGGAD